MSHNLVYEPFSDDNREEALQCVSAVFCENEPICTTLALSPESFATFFRPFYGPDLADGLSFACRDGAGGPVVGVVHALDFGVEAAWASANEAMLGELITPKIEIVNAILEECEAFLGQKEDVATAMAAHGGHPPEGMLCHVLMVCTDPEYRRMGIVRKLMAMCHEAAVAKGFQYAFAECTNIKSSMLLQNHYGYSVLDTVVYADWETKDPESGEQITPFASLIDPSFASQVDFVVADLSPGSLPGAV